MNTKLHRFAAFVAFATFILIIAGGLVTSTGSGLSVPDWPLSFGKLMPPMEGGVFYEHGHRMIATTIGLLTILLAFGLWKFERPGIRVLGFLALGMVLLQGVLGGLTVLLKLPPQVSVAHALIGPIFFSLIVTIAVLTGISDLSPQPRESQPLGKLRRLGLLTSGFILFQMFLGAVLRHTGWGLHAHLTGAFLVLVHVILLARRTIQQESEDAAFLRSSILMIVIVALQITLGLLAWRLPTVVITTAHQGTGSALLAAAVVLTVLSYIRRQPT